MSDDKNLNAIRKHYLYLIETKQREIQALREKIKLVEKVSGDANLFFAPADKYKDFKLTAAVIDAVRTLHDIGAAEPDGVSASEVIKFLDEHGFEKQPHNFDVAVHVTLDRLSSKSDGRILKSRESGKKRYKPVENVFERFN